MPAQQGGAATPTADPAYDENELQAGWQEEVAGWAWEQFSGRTKRKSGPCPRCGDTMTVDARAGLVANLLPGKSPRPVLARCNCSANHDGHPDRPHRDWGCGFRTQVPGPGS